MTDYYDSGDSNSVKDSTCRNKSRIKTGMSAPERKKNRTKASTAGIVNAEEDSKSFTDFMCPICLQLLVEPVVLPCHHELCTPCFQTHITETSLQCPMCRKRISVWARRRKKEGSFVDQERWDLIQRLFPERCRRRLNGEDITEEEDYGRTNTHKPVLASSGEIRKEYERELEKVREEREQESLASEEFVRKLQEEEEKNANVYSNQEIEDQKLALQLQEEEIRQIGTTVSSPSTPERELLSTFGQLQERNLRNKPSASPQASPKLLLTSSGRKKRPLKRGLQSPTTGSAAKNSSTIVSASENSKTKENLKISKWLTRQDSGGSSPGSSPKPFSNNFRKLQEELDRDIARQLQQQLDTEERHVRGKIDDHFQPLREKFQHGKKKKLE